MSRPPSEMPPPPGRTPGQGPERRPGDRPPPSSPPPAWARILPWLLILALIAVFALPSITTGSGSSKDLSYSAFLNHVENGDVKSVEFNKDTGDINGKFNTDVGGTKSFTSSGPKDDFQQNTVGLLRKKHVNLTYTQNSSNFLLDLLPLFLPVLLIIGFFVWMGRRQAAGMGAVFAVGVGKAATPSSAATTSSIDAGRSSGRFCSICVSSTVFASST